MTEFEAIADSEHMIAGTDKIDDSRRLAKDDELEAKRELRYAIKHRSLQRNGSFAARMNDNVPKGHRARANLRGKQR